MSGAQEAFQYAIWRVVPSLVRGERLNVGVVLHCRRHAFLDAVTVIDRERVAAFDASLDLDALEAHLDGLVRVARGDAEGGAVAGMDRSDRFGFLTSPTSTIVQPSEVHVGLATDPPAELARLARELLG